jgi:hypothetical protein
MLLNFNPSKPGDDGEKTIWQLIGGQIEKDHANDPTDRATNIFFWPIK